MPGGPRQVSAPGLFLHHFPHRIWDLVFNEFSMDLGSYLARFSCFFMFSAYHFRGRFPHGFFSILGRPSGWEKNRRHAFYCMKHISAMYAFIRMAPFRQPTPESNSKAGTDERRKKNYRKLHRRHPFFTNTWGTPSGTISVALVPF